MSDGPHQLTLGANPNTAASVRFLSDPTSYPEGTAGVEVCETHMAYVFLTDHFAYKMKKPVRYEFLDFSTVALRRRICEEEVRLNRRLAPDVYLGTVPLHVEAGRVRLGGAATAGSATVDWLVQMRRLPRERMLDAVIRTGGPSDDEMRALAALLISFYRSTPPEPTLPQVYLDRLQHDVDADVRALMDHADQLPVDLIRCLGSSLIARLRQHAAAFRARAEHGRIVEAHGDLRPEHICLTTPPVIIDCLEFRRDFRLLDPADELGVPRTRMRAAQRARYRAHATAYLSGGHG